MLSPTEILNLAFKLGFQAAIPRATIENSEGLAPLLIKVNGGDQDYGGATAERRES